MRLSVNIESPADLSASAASYYPTSQSIEFVRGLASAALDGGGAHALLGPYGVGKSSLAAFALNELSYPTSFFEPTARPHLFGADKSPVAEVLSAGGLVPMPVVGAPESLASRVVLALQSLANNDSALKGAPALDSCTALDPRKATADQALFMLVDAARAIRKQGKAGALLIIDEFGRHLEHMLSTSSDGDLHLLQNIAEATGRADSPISLVIIQHLGLEHYGSMLRGSMRYEWDKVRGRFVETVLNHTETDAARIVSRVLRVLEVARSDRRPPLRFPKSAPHILRDRHFLAAAQECLPLHPMTVALLSRLAKVIGQNDRTMVGWLTSNMDSGFQALRERTRGGWLYPASLYEHFFRDALWAPPNPAFAKRFAAIHTAHERMGDDLSIDARLLFKTLALLSFCAGRGIGSDRPSALACLPKGFPFDRSMEELTSRSLVLYRHYRNEYVVWEGSDYDVSGRIDAGLSRLSLEVAEEMNRRSPPPVLAHGHLIRTGNRRTAPVLWLNDGDTPPEADGKPRILVWLVGRPHNVALVNDVVGVSDACAIEPHLRESAAIRRLLDEDAELQEDIVATKEMESRLAFHEERIASVYQDVLESDLNWHVGKNRYASMQEALSNAMDVAYPKAFKLHNELINRDRVSSPVAFALRKLISQLYVGPDQENLGIDKFPAERIICESMLKQTGLYTCANNDKWQLRLEGSALVPGLPDCIAEARRLFVNGQHPAVPSVEGVAAHLAAPPYGVKRAPALLLCILILLDDKDVHELYEDGQFLPHWGPDTLLRMVKAPQRFTIVASTASPVGPKLMQEYKKALVADDCMAVDITPVFLAREVLRRHAHLSPYAQRTQTVSHRAQALRRAIKISTSPGDMLFRKIPLAFGYPSLPTRVNVRKRYLKILGAAWRDLEGADQALLARLESAALDSLGCTTIRRARLRCRDFAKSLLDDGDLHHGYENFLSHILDDTIAESRIWLASLVDNGLGISIPLKSWSDDHASQGEFLLRRNLLALQQTGDLLKECKVQRDASPFVVFWPNPNIVLGKATRGVAEQMTSLADSLSSKERAAVIMDLAKESAK